MAKELLTRVLGTIFPCFSLRATTYIRKVSYDGVPVSSPLPSSPLKVQGQRDWGHRDGGRQARNRYMTTHVLGRGEGRDVAREMADKKRRTQAFLKYEDRGAVALVSFLSTYERRKHRLLSPVCFGTASDRPTTLPAPSTWTASPLRRCVTQLVRNAGTRVRFSDQPHVLCRSKGGGEFKAVLSFFPPPFSKTKAASAPVCHCCTPHMFPIHGKGPPYLLSFRRSCCS